ncbi:hypothetical protein C9374_009675 [Naegleria lovaniensis]|uniref:Uncharacterized protein n=1 Tax=Naegleria lovaniensis TaxID=51637 RepID=A0AA88KPG4_NAELO|nr:uncharacterized protein C9374_009675 [Naegleria lovaniensis]KAG2393098.1 hypothetical protein C9374_009675 [Naegleria lovaniensis]
MEFTTFGISQNYLSYVDSGISGGGSTGSVYGFQSWHAALMYKVTGTVSYCTFAVSDADALVTSEESRISNNQNPEVAGDSYLHVGEQIGNIMMVYDWCRAQTTSSQRSR